MTPVSQSLDFASGSMPKLENCLVLPSPRRKNHQVGHSPFMLAIQKGLPHRPADGEAFAGSSWKATQPDEDGFIFTNNGNSPIYAEWTEPRDRMVLAQFMFGGAELGGHIFNGKRQPNNKWGDIPLELTPLKLRAGKQSVIAGSAMKFLLYPVKSRFVFNPRTALTSDIVSGQSSLYDGSVVAINCTDLDQTIELLSQVDDGPIVKSRIASLEAMNSRTVRFKYRSSAGLSPGSHQLKLWVSGDLPSSIEIKVSVNGEAFRRTYIGKHDGAVHAYTVVPPPEGPVGKPVVGFLYGGNPHGSHVIAREFKSRPGYSVVIPEARGATWSGLAGRDALETLDHACRELKANRTQTYLFGHSMGGHGAYLLASLNPSAFAGVGASAGWISLHTYLKQKRLNLDDPIESVFDKVMEEQRVEERYDRLAAVGNFAVVHGDKDDSVLMSESKLLRGEMLKRGSSFELLEQPGLEHFWSKNGMNQYDFPPVIEKLMTSPNRGDGKFLRLAKMPPTWLNGLSKRVAIVYGTRGSARESTDALDKARAEEAQLRNFMRIESKVMKDDVEPNDLKGWNVILIGNAQTNALWSAHPTATMRLLEASRRGHTVDGWLIQGMKGKDTWSVIGGKNEQAAMAVYQLTQQWYEAPFPEWTLFDSSRLVDGFGWVVGVGQNDGTHGWRSGQ